MSYIAMIECVCSAGVIFISGKFLVQQRRKWISVKRSLRLLNYIHDRAEERQVLPSGYRDVARAYAHDEKPQKAA